MEQFKIYTDGMQRLLKERKVCLSSRKSHGLCYSLYESYLDRLQLPLSHDTILGWLQNEIEPNYDRQVFNVWWKYMEQMEEFIQTGTVAQDNLLLIKPASEKLPEQWRSLLDSYLAECAKSNTARTVDQAKRYCAGALTQLCARGIVSIHGITYDDICYLYQEAFHCKKNTWYIKIGSIRRFLHFCAGRGLCPISYALMLDANVFPYVPALSDLPPEQQAQIRTINDRSILCTPEELFKYQDKVEKLYAENNYAATARNTLHHVVRTLYVFLLRNGLNYHPVVADLWYGKIAPSIGNSCLAWKRCLKVLSMEISQEKIDLKKRFFPVNDRMAPYPCMIRSAVEDYFAWMIRSFHAQDTVRTYQYSVFAFCDWMVAAGLDGFQDVSVELVRDFLASEMHATPNGYSSRVTVLRQFFWFLEEQEHLLSGNLYQRLPARIARGEKIVDILSDSEIEAVYRYRAAAVSPMELRNAAMVIIGLRMGFRASDVINLSMADIDWKNFRISIQQKKTHAALVLPMPNDVGNTIFAYLKKGRPEKEPGHVFIRHKAPYSPLTNKLCDNALYAILPEKKDKAGATFHSLRRTFATSILRRSAGIGAVIDALGHQDHTTVMKYLSFDEERMSACPLSLAECGIPTGGVL